jgi:hypothetical protein
MTFDIKVSERGLVARFGYPNIRKGLVGLVLRSLNLKAVLLEFYPLVLYYNLRLGLARRG